MAPAYLLTEFKYAHQIHAYYTRHRDLLRLPLAKTTKYQGSFRFKGARAFNTLSLSIRSVNEQQGVQDPGETSSHALFTILALSIFSYSALFLMCFYICITLSFSCLILLK